MRREKLLWGGGGAIIAAAITSSLFLAFPMQPTPGAGADRSASPAVNPDDRSDNSASNDNSATVASVGNIYLSNERFMSDLASIYGDEYIQEWMERTAVRLEAQALGIDVSREEIDRELKRQQQGYDSEEQFYRTMKEQLGLSEDELRAEALYQLQLEKIATWGVVVSESEMERYISEHPEDYGPQQEIRLAQIIVETVEDADAVLGLLANGADFSQVAAERSIDSTTSSAGGELGWMNVSDPFIDAHLLESAKQLSVGGISSPIVLDDGHYAVILLMGKREIRPANDAAVRSTLRRELAISKAPPLSVVLDRLLTKWEARSELK
jgi:foldase protein PrsA